MVYKRLCALMVLLLLPAAVWAQQVTVAGVRMWPAPDSTRLVFDVSAPVKHAVFTLPNPDRIVIDLTNTTLKTSFDKLKYPGSLLKGIRSAPRHGHDLRVVLDLTGPVRPKTFMLRPNGEYGNRLVVDLEDASAKSQAVKAQAEPNVARDLVVAIDAGHGGDDPGASGPDGIHEKDVVLAIAQRLKRLVDKTPGMRAVMTRSGDYYVSLRTRVKKAREAKADLFVSIHADAFPDPRARGTSVYALSARGASSEHARLLAVKENAADLVGGVSLDDKDDLLASVLLDLSQTATIEASIDVAGRVLRGFKKLGRLHKRRVEQAGFLVLKAPDIPSILVETAFITNPHEERLLNSPRHQQEMAVAVMSGIKSYFADHPPTGTRLVQKERKHTITRGETLSEIARRYQVSVSTLRIANGLNGDMVRVGEVLRIPPPG